MRLFLLLFFTVYSLVHLYGFLKIRSALFFSLKTSLPLILFMMVMVAAPVLVRVLENNEFYSSARFMSYTGYVWMGIVVLFFWFSLTLDLYHLLISGAQFIVRKDLTRFTLSPRFAFLVTLSLSLITALYGYFEALSIKAEHIIVTSPKIPDKVGTIRIVQISDVHVGLIVRHSRLKRILSKVKEADPDILVSTGDLIDGQINRLQGIAELFQEIKPRYGKYAIRGNHEYYAGLTQAMEFTQRAGFTLLVNKGITVQGLINLVGVDDQAAQRYGLSHNFSEKELLSQMPEDKFTLFLKHRPFIEHESTRFFNMQLSGHAHKGQIFPFRLITKTIYPTDNGYLELPNHSFLYVSRGSGTWGPPIRVLSPPEVTIIDLVHDPKKVSISEARKRSR